MPDLDVRSSTCQRAGSPDPRRRPGTEFDSVFGTETIERFLHSSFDESVLRATVVKFPPLTAGAVRPGVARVGQVQEGRHDDGKRTVLRLSRAGRNSADACSSELRFQQVHVTPGGRSGGHHGAVSPSGPNLWEWARIEGVSD